MMIMCVLVPGSTASEDSVPASQLHLHAPCARRADRSAADGESVWKIECSDRALLELRVRRLQLGERYRVQFLALRLGHAHELAHCMMRIAERHTFLYEIIRQI